MKAILYVLANRFGDVETFYFGRFAGKSVDATLLREHAPEHLHGKSKKKFDALLKADYSLSNWHVMDL